MNGASAYSNNNSFSMDDGRLPFLFEYATARASMER